MLVHRKNMIRVTVGWTNQFIMNPKIQMSEGDALRTDPIQQNQRRPQQGGTFSPELRCYRLVSPKSLGQSLPGGSSKAANLVHLEQLFDLYMWGLSAGSGELPGFPQWQLLPFLFALPHPSPCQEFGICSVSEQLPLTGFISTSLLGVNYNR